MIFIEMTHILGLGQSICTEWVVSICTNGTSMLKIQRNKSYFSSTFLGGAQIRGQMVHEILKSLTVSQL